MTRDEIIKMAQEAGMYTMPRGIGEYDKSHERFAALVAAAEREAMKIDGWRQCAKGQRTTQFCGQVQAAVEAEREACLRKCTFGRSSADIEIAIRARGEK